MTLSQQLRELAGKATRGPWSVDGPPWNRIIWSSAENRVAFMAHSNGSNDERDMATPELIAALVNSLPTILTALELQERLGGMDADAIAKEVADKCHGNRKPDQAQTRYAIIWQAARFGAQAAINALKGGAQ